MDREVSRWQAVLTNETPATSPILMLLPLPFSLRDIIINSQKADVTMEIEDSNIPDLPDHVQMVCHGQLWSFWLLL